MAIVEGAAGEKQFSDRAVRDPVVVALRDRVVATIDPTIKEEQVRVLITLKDGRHLEKYIEHAIGSVQHPMTDAQLEAKFSDLAEGILPAGRARQLMDLCWKIEDQSDAAVLARTAVV